MPRTSKSHCKTVHLDLQISTFQDEQRKAMKLRQSGAIKHHMVSSRSRQDRDITTKHVRRLNCAFVLYMEHKNHELHG
jgi:hypothetical protein